MKARVNFKIKNFNYIVVVKNSFVEMRVESKCEMSFENQQYGLRILHSLNLSFFKHG